MKSQEKAKELIERFEDALTVKDCALIAVNEMLKVAFFLADHKIYDHLLEVKQEIENYENTN
jgi:hypothetical protein